MQNLVRIFDYFMGAGKRFIALSLLIVPFLSYIFATVYVKYKSDVESVRMLNERFENIEELVKESIVTQKRSEDSILFTIYRLDGEKTRQINLMLKNMVSEFSNQLRFVVQYQNQNTQMVLDHLDTWRESYLLRDSLNIKVERQ